MKLIQDEPDEHPLTPRRCYDMTGWLRAVASLTDDLPAPTRNGGAKRVNVRTVKALAVQLVTYADGPSSADPGGNIRPGNDRLARELPADESTVRAGLAALQAAALLQLVHPHTRAHAAVYALAVPDEAVAGNGRGVIPGDDGGDRGPIPSDQVDECGSFRADWETGNAHQCGEGHGDSANGPDDRGRFPVDQTGGRGRLHAHLSRISGPGPGPGAHSQETGTGPREHPLADLVPEHRTGPARQEGERLLQQILERLPSNDAAKIDRDRERSAVVDELTEIAARGAMSADRIAAFLTEGWPDQVHSPIRLLTSRERLGKLRERLNDYAQRDTIASSDRGRRAQAGRECENTEDEAVLPVEDVESIEARFASLPTEEQRLWRQAALAQLRRELPGVPARENSPLVTARGAWLWERGDATTRPAEVDDEAADTDEGDRGSDRRNADASSSSVDETPYSSPGARGGLRPAASRSDVEARRGGVAGMVPGSEAG